MKYVSTRGKITKDNAFSSAEAIKLGLAADGGLFMPEQFPAITMADIKSMIPMSYAERAYFILSKYLTDYPEDMLKKACREAYSEDRFPGGPAPVVKVKEDLYSLELWHGPTCAFKDEALQIMPKLLSGALKITNEDKEALILVATSGDTGKAALEGYMDVDQVKIMVFYPSDGVSAIQKLQMATQSGKNVGVCAVKGNFDDAQSGVKKIFSDPDAAAALSKKGCFFSSANSINWGRLVPQIVYYVSAYCDLLQKGDVREGEQIVFCVPTGNFGNILAAYIAKQMGLPIKKLICASNRNNVLTDFIKTGTYDRMRTFYPTMSPSMDILISSNLERLLYLLSDTTACARYMKDLAEKGSYTVSDELLLKIKDVFAGEFADEAECAKTIADTYNKYGYLCDPHTAVGIAAANKSETDGYKVVVASTASPYKFARDVYASLGGNEIDSDFDAIEKLSRLTGTSIPAPIALLKAKEVRFSDVIDPSDMLKYTLSKLD